MRLFSDVASRVEDPYLRRATILAERGRGFTAPNPLVGCVIVSDGQVVGEGHHPRAGEPHAEVYALAAAGDSARGSDVYVTLEPCRHQGRTPPCTAALIDAGVGHVIIGMADPSAEAGGGAVALREAGVGVTFAADPSPFLEMNAGWIKRANSGIPHVTVKVALSLDAAPALMQDARASITGPSGAEVTRLLRNRSDAVLVGASTVIVDDPSLTVRASDGTLCARQPLRVILARSEAPDTSHLIFDGRAPTLVLLPESGGCADGASALPETASVGRYPLADGLFGALRVLGSLGINDLLIEAGPRLFTALLQDDLIDELVVVTAGGVAGSSAPPLFGGEGISSNAELTRIFKPQEVGIVGDVAVTVWSRSNADQS